MIKEIAINHVDGGADRVEVAKEDLVAAWTLLENLVVSMNRIGSHFAYSVGESPDPRNEKEFERALGRFLAEREVWSKVVEARGRLGEYITDREAEALSDRLAFWRLHETATPGSKTD